MLGLTGGSNGTPAAAALPTFGGAPNALSVLNSTFPGPNANTSQANAQGYDPNVASFLQFLAAGAPGASAQQLAQLKAANPAWSPPAPAAQANTAASGPSFLQSLQAALTPPQPPQVTVSPIIPLGFNSFWDPTAYNNALASVQQQGARSQAVDNQSFAAANASQQANNALAAQQAQKYVQQAQQNASQLGGMQQGFMNAAQQEAGSGGLLGTALGAQQALFNTENQRQVQNADFFQFLGNQDARGFNSSLALSQAAANNNLQAAISGESAKIGTTEAAAQGQAQSRYASYLDQVQRDNASAQAQAAATNAKDAYDAQLAAQNNLKVVLPLITATETSPSSQLGSMLNNGQISANMGAAIGSVLYGKALDGTDIMGNQQTQSGTKQVAWGSAKDLQTALYRVPQIAKAYNVDPSQLQQYVGMQFQTQKQFNPNDPTLMALLATMGASGQ